MPTPVIIVNLKLYAESAGERAVEIAKQAQEVQRETGATFGIAPSMLDAWVVARAVEIPVYVQHVDPVDPGARTGHVSPKLLKEYGLAGSLVNHSERRLKLADIAKVVSTLKEEGLTSIVCAGNPRETLAVAALEPTAVAFEPPELIGTGISVSKARPEAVTETVELVRTHHPGVTMICGAGISTGEDVKRALELGVDGVLLASAVAKSPNPKKKMEELAAGARNVLKQ